MPARKRGRQEAGLDSSVVAVESAQPRNETLDRLRNMWQFAALMQYIYLFGRVVKIDADFDMEDLEHECLRPEPSEKLAEIGLALLKYVSSHRGLTHDIFDDYTRRQYLAKAPLRNPFGDDEDPLKFSEFDVFNKIRVLQQLSTWTLGNAERIRGGMEEKDNEQTQWRIEELGWDSEDRSYFVLDDDRLYRRTDAPLPPEPKPKPKSKAKARRSRGTRTSKRVKLSTPSADGENDGEEQETAGAEAKEEETAEDDGFGGMKWECLAVTFEDYQIFLESIRRSKDPNEKILHKRITEQVMPIIEKKVEAQRQKVLKKQRELENLQKMATAKRSSRIAGRMEQRKAEEEQLEAERKRLADIEMAKKEQNRQSKLEHARESRMLTREQRLKEREVKRILHEEELRKLEEDQKNMEMGLLDESAGRISERRLKAEMEKRQKELDQLAEEEGEWMFDCAVCGVHGANLDDGTHSIACENCNIWQHSKCHNIDEKEADKEDFHFICSDCSKPKLPPLHLHFPGSKDSPRGRTVEAVQITASSTPRPSSQRTSLLDGPALSPAGQSPGPPGYHPQAATPVGVPQKAWNGATLPPPPRPSSNLGSSPPPPANGSDRAASPSNQPSLHLLHQQAHAGAVSSHIPPPNGHGLHMGPPSPQKAASRPSSSHASVAPVERRLSLNGLGTPHHQHQPRPSASPSSQAHIFQSPNTSFPPPALLSTHQRAAAHSPTKQPSSSPSHPPSFYTPASTYSYAPHVTPQPPSAVNILRPSPGMHSSPIPPLPAGNTPIIPTKHDTPRPRSRDSIGETPVLPPVTALSPSFPPTRPGFGIEGVKGVETDLGVGSVPVKRLPPEVEGQRDGNANGNGNGNGGGDLSMGDI